MNKSVFEISKMDCPSEENLIRMKLDEISSIKNLDFDIPNRKLTVFHEGEIQSIEESLKGLKLGTKKIKTEQTEQTEFRRKYSTKKITLVCTINKFCIFYHRNDNWLNLKIYGVSCR